MRRMSSLVASSSILAMLPYWWSTSSWAWIVAPTVRRTPTRLQSTTSLEHKMDMEARLGTLERQAATSLGGFFEPHLQSFSVKPGSVKRLSITSTCFALQAIRAACDIETYESLVSPIHAASEEGRISLRTVWKALVESEWRSEDLFQVPLLLYTLLLVDSQRHLLTPRRMNEELASRIRRLVEASLQARPQRRLGAQQRYSDYIMYQTALAFALLQSSTSRPMMMDADNMDVSRDKETGIGNLPLQALPEGSANQLSVALARCVEVSLTELHRQLAVRVAGDDAAMDVNRLAYSLLTYTISSQALAGTAGLELIPGQGPQPGSMVGPVNMKIVRAALKAFFEQQLPNGQWDKGQPIYKSFRQGGLNIGNAFVFCIDTLGALLQRLPAEEFRPYLPQLENTLIWIEQHQTVQVISDYCDVESGQCYGKPLRGWSSPHLSPDASPQGWSTAQVLICVSQMRRLVRQLMNTDVLLTFRGVSYSAEGPVDSYWKRLLDSDLGLAEKRRTLKQVLNERVIEPFHDSVSSPSFGAAYSAILFGPPGTAKTTICEALARKMGWDFLTIDTSVFLAQGLGNVASQIRYVFERLQVLDRCVILFDEIEEFCLDRETPGIGMESRMLTTAMLTAINDLRRAKRSVFFLATNRLRAFDSAITRPGRFDMQLFVGTPNLESRCTMFRQQLASAAVEESTQHNAMKLYREFLDGVWSKTAMFMNYLEGMQFARACADLVQKDELNVESMQRILATQEAVMTVRGSVRTEFLASMELSRV